MAINKASRKVSGFWLPLGIVLSLATTMSGYKPANYYSVPAYVVGMGAILVAIASHYVLSRLRSGHSESEIALVRWERAMLCAFVLGTIAFGWLIGDLLAMWLLRPQ